MSGTWTSHFKSLESNLIKVSPKLDNLSAATLRTNPGTGTFLLSCFTLYLKKKTFLQTEKVIAGHRVEYQINRPADQPKFASRNF
jgi:hypothetical protein